MQESRRKFLAGAGALGVGAATIPANRLLAAEEKIRLTIAASHQLSDPPVGALKSTFVAKANEELEQMKSSYRVDWTEAYGGSLYNFRETLAAVTGGVTDVGWIGSIFAPAQLPLQNIIIRRCSRPTACEWQSTS